jgi:hypothetical protein
MTLPKKLRGKFQTIHYIAQEVPDGVLLRPVEEVQYYENPDGSFGVKFPYGIEAGKLAKMMRKAMKELDQEEKKKKSRKPRRSHG